MAKLPYFPFWPLDWLRDTRKLSPTAKSAWIDILALAWNEPQRGIYRRTIEAMEYELGMDLERINRVIDELVGVANVTREGEKITIMSRRMMKEETAREYERKKKKWQREKEDVPEMSPNCPAIVPQEKLEVRSQKLEVSTSKSTQMGAKAPPPRFVQPTAEEVTSFASTIGFKIDGQQFVDHYESNGWKVGRNSMKSWQAAVRNWMRMEKERRVSNGTGPRGKERRIANQFVTTDPSKYDKYE